MRVAATIKASVTEIVIYEVAVAAWAVSTELSLLSAAFMTAVITLGTAIDVPGSKC